MTRLPVGGVENQLLTVLRNYDKDRYHPVVCSLSDRGDIGREIEDHGIEVIALNKLKHTFDWTVIRDIYKVLKERDIKIVRTHQYHANFYGRIAAILARVPCIVASVHNIYKRDKKIHRRMINSLLGKKTDLVVAVSDAVKEEILKYDCLRRDRITVINNGIEKDVFVPEDRQKVRGALGISSDKCVLGTVGRLTVQKGHKYLFEAFASLKEKYPHLEIAIVGDGPLKNDLVQRAHLLGISHRVHFFGMRRDIPALLSAIDVFILPSLWEGLVNALLEAMAAGKPVIASDLKQIREIIDSNDVGRLVPPEDSHALALTIEEMIRNDGTRRTMGEAARRRVVERFSIDRTVRIYTSWFEDILRRKRVL